MSTFRVALLQTDPLWQDPEYNRQQIAQQIAQAPGIDLIVLPEMFTAGFGSEPRQFSEPPQGNTFQWLQQQAANTNSAICGSYGVNVTQGVANRFVWCEPDGKHYFYDKRHLFRMAGEHTRYVSGTERLVLQYRDWRINPQICYDLRFPVWCRNQHDYDVQIFVANWPGARRHAWRTLLQARAIENQAYVIGVNRTGVDGKGLEYTGDSLVVSPEGDIVVDAKDKAGLYTTTLDIEHVRSFRERFPAHQDADAFEIRLD